MLAETQRSCGFAFKTKNKSGEDRETTSKIFPVNQANGKQLFIAAKEKRRGTERERERDNGV